MKTKRRLVAGVLFLTMLLATFGSGFTVTALTVTTDSELAYEPLAETASIAYEKHESGYTVSLDRAADSVTMNITAVPAGDSSRAAEKAQLYVRTGVELKPGVAYRVSFSISAEQVQPEYAVCFDGGAAECAYGRLDKRSIAAGGEDRVDYQITPEKESGELVLRLMLGKTGVKGNTLRLSGLAVEEAVAEAVGESRVLVDSLDYSEPGAITYWANEDSGASVTSDGSSATLTVTRTPATGAEVWKIKLMVATGLKPEAGKTYRISYDIKSSSSGTYEVCYNEGDTEKGYDVLYSQRLSDQKETRSRRIYVPSDKEDPGELVLQLSLGKLGKGTKVTVSNVRVEEAVPQYTNALGKNFAYDKTSVIKEYDSNNYNVTSVDRSYTDIVNWTGTAVTDKHDDGGNMSEVTIADGVVKMDVTAVDGNEQASWKSKVYIKTGITLESGKNYNVSFDIRGAHEEADWEINFGKGGDNKDYGAVYSGSLSKIETTEKNAKNPISNVARASNDELWIIICLGKSVNTYWIKNIKVEEGEAPVDPPVDPPSGGNLANVTYPQTEPGSFKVRDDGGYSGIITGDGSSATMICTGGTGEVWQRGMWIKDAGAVVKDSKYRVSFNITASEDTDYQVAFLNNDDWTKIYDTDATGKNTSADGNFSFDITPKENGTLWLRIEFGKAPTGAQITVSNVTVQEITDGDTVSENSISNVSYPQAELGSFKVRDDGGYSGIIAGDGSSATMICTGGTGEVWQRGMWIKDAGAVVKDSKYRVSFNITASEDTDYQVAFLNNDDWTKIYDTDAAGKNTSADGNFSFDVTPKENGTLWLRIEFGKAPTGAQITVSNVTVQDITDETARSNTHMAPAARDAVEAVDIEFGSISAEGIDGYRAELTRNDGNAVLSVTKEASAEEPGNWRAKLFIHTGMNYDSSKAYRLIFDIEATEAQREFVVVAQGIPDTVDVRGTWGLSLAAGQKKTVTTRAFPGSLGSGEVAWALELGNLNPGVDSNTFTVSNIRVEEVDIEPVLLSSRTEGTVTNDMQTGYSAILTRETDSASLKLLRSPASGAEAWKSKLFLNTGVSPSPDEAYRVTFDVLTEEDADFEVCYNRGDKEKGYDALYGLHTEGGKVKTVEKVFTAESAGTLIVQLSLGMVKAPNAVTVNNLKVERIRYSYSGKSALPAELSYKAPGAVSYWAHEDYTAAFTGSGSAVTANITNAPKTGAEPWKIKLFLDTGAPLEAGRYYKVTADVKARSDQDYEICYNNGGAEMGYGSLGGLHLEGGKAQTVEKTLAVPAGKTDLGSLTLQLNLGKTTSANEISVSGVKVEELPLSYVNAMAADFSYKSGAVELQADPDYTATLEKSDTDAKLHITGVPATGAGVWKVKLLVSTGALLQAGKTYLVHADLLAAKGQSYEVCFNNEETEKGFDALYGQTFTAGSKTTIERTISVPESMTDAGELVLQFSVGGDVTNDITVSGVSVKELDFGAGSGSAAPDAVISLRSPAGALDVTREKISCSLAKMAGDDALTIAGADLRANDLYTVTFTARSDKDMSGMFALTKTGGGAPVISEQFRLTPEEAVYSFTTAARLSEGGLYDLLWQFASPDNQKPGSAGVEISDISVYSPSERLEIVHSAQTVSVNGETAAPDIYNINGSNYFKLRDLAMLLNNTDAQFVVRYNKKDDSISLTTGKAYVPAGGELTVGEDKSASCVRSPQNVTVNGGKVNLKSYNIGGSNFFRLRDLNGLLGFTVDYIAESNSVAITSPLTPDAQEKAHGYDIFFLPGIDSESQGYVGDTMPYYENGVYYIYYLKEGGDSYNHSVYLTTTTDFVSYTEYDEPVLSASREDVQDSWIGTGSVVKVDGTYYFFYTGYNASGSQEYHEKIMVAKGSSPTSFEKVGGWEITPPAELGQKNDFRDPQAYYDAQSRTVSLTVTASQDGAARILKYTLGKDLKNVSYDGIIFTDPTGAFFNLECSDTFRIGNKWYLTYSGQEDTLWYAMADSRFGPYSAPARLDGKLFYAAKHVEDGTNAYMVGWARRSNSASSTQEVSGWAGNIAVQKLRQQPDGSLSLVPVDSIVSSFGTQMELASGEDKASLKAGPGRSYEKAFTSYESFMLSGEFTYSGTGSFGLAFDFNGKEEQYKLISIDPEENRLSLSLNGGAAPITGTQAALEANKTHSFTYIQDGSVGIFYLDGQAALTVRLYGVTGKPIYLFAENNSVEFTSLRQYT